MWLFEEIIKLIVGKCLFTVRTRFRVIAEDGRMKGFFIHLYQRAKFGATIPTSKHQLCHSFVMTKISYFNIKLSTPIEQSNEKKYIKTHNFHRFLMLDVLYSSLHLGVMLSPRSYYHSQSIKLSYLTGECGDNADIS
jgi:hypothetical protein